MTHPADPIVSTSWLANHLGQPDLKVIDAPFYMPGDPRTPQGEYGAAHIPGAALFDLEAIADHATGLPHMLAAPEVFAAAVGAMGIGAGDRLVVYDHIGLLSAARVWWNFRVMGHDQVFVLDGGLPRWIAEGRPTEQGAPAPVPPAAFVANVRPALVRTIDQVKQALDRGGQVLDARSSGRFRGIEPEPRPGLPSGHMPGSSNLPHSEIVLDGRLLAAADLAAKFEVAGVDPALPIIATCGSGVSAAILALALARLGHWDTPVYDGSWTEWASQPDAAIVRDGNSTHD
ncbi:MAG TPA: 3-mercaptopyruvate sulfurtransferase [Caulobacteraceae bacterium]|nr:3-mercaptopyruvate sulfurtransferase [Caulobacteraceae bacterium]